MNPESRVAAPRLGPHIVARPRIVERLDERWNRAVISIVAGAGFGKSTVLAQAMSSNSISPRGRDIWLSLEARDNDASTLLSTLAQLLSGDHQPRSVDATVEHVAQMLATHAPLDIAILLDDTQALEPNSTGAIAVAQLLESLPTNAHLVLAGRRSLELKLARLLAHDRAVELTEEDLRFSPSERAQLADNLGADRSAPETDLGGWAALLTLHHRFGLRKVTDFALEEVLSHISPTNRQQLMIAALVDGAVPAQIEAVASEAGFGTGDDAAPFDLASLPLVSAEPSGIVRPHHLWRDIFSATTNPDELDRVRRAGAAVLLGTGEPGRAWELLAAAGDQQSGLPALYDAINDQNTPPGIDRIERWLAAIPESLQDRAEVRYLRAIRLRETRPWSAQLDDEMDAALDAFEASGDIARYLGSAIRATFSVWLTCNQSRLAQLGQVARRYEHAAPGLSAVGVLNRAAQADAGGEGDLVLDVLKDLSVDDFEPRLAFFVPLYRTAAYLNTGRSNLALAPARQAALAAARCDGAGGTLLSTAAESLVRFLDGELDVDIDSPPWLDGGGYNVGEQLELKAWRGIIAAHQGRIVEADAILADLTAPHRPGFELPRFASARAVLAATLDLSTNGERGTTEPLAALLAEPGRIGAEWRAIAWHPGVPLLVDAETAVHLVDTAEGFAARPQLRLALAVTRLRNDGGYSVADTPIDNPPQVFAALPLPPVIELACAAGAAKDERSTALLEYASNRWPGPTRHTLRAIADSGLPHAKTAARLVRRVPIPPAEPLRIAVLGPLTLMHGDRSTDSADWRRDRVRQLLMHLVHHRSVSRDRLAAVLWPELDAEAAARNLRLTLHYLHGVLEPERSPGDAPFFVRQRDASLELTGGEHLIVDSWRFDQLESMADRALANGDAQSAVAHLSEIVNSWRGDYLVDLTGSTDTELEPHRESFRRRCARHTIRLAELLVASGRFEAAADAARRGIQADPWSERAFCGLAAALDAMGDAPGALRTLAQCRSMLGELNLQPSPETAMLERRIRAARGPVDRVQPE
ncbi:MAG: hypothetical protein KDB16_20425 [Acidimicrobiales bacterium]|nr:hypothetical protein [Acidimicrobiales bacterium]